MLLVRHRLVKSGELMQMKTIFKMGAVAVVLFSAGLTTVSVRAQDAGILRLPQDIEFKGPLSGPPQTVVLYGDPTKPGFFVTRVKFSAGWKDPPHWHPEEVRTVARSHFRDTLLRAW